VYVSEVQPEYMNPDPNYRFSLPQTDDWLIGCREIYLAPSTHVPVVWTQKKNAPKNKQTNKQKKKTLLPDYSYASQLVFSLKINMICSKSKLF